MEVGSYVMFKESSGSFTKGTKVMLLAKIKFDGCSTVGSAIIEHHKGSPWNCVDQNGFEMVEMVEDYIHQETKVTFIPLYVLTEYVFDGNFILYDLCTKWSTYRSDHYSKFRQEFLERNGYDIHKSVYH